MDAIVYDKVGKEAEKVREALYGIYPQETITDAAIASFDDGADGIPVKALTVGIEPVQDLHGYANPWPAGGGVNKFDQDTVFGNAGAQHEIDGSWYFANVSVIQTGTPIWQNTSGYSRQITISFAYKTLNASGPNGARFKWKYSDDTEDIISISNSTSFLNLTNTSASGKTVTELLWDYGSAANSTWLKDVQVELNVTATSFAPYSNECPISGHTGAEIEQTGKNLFDKTVLTQYSGVVLNDDGSLYIGDNSVMHDKIAWKNKKEYAGQIAITYRYKFATTESAGLYPRIVYTDGTSTNVGVSVVQDFNTVTLITDTNKTVDHVTFTYGARTNSTTFFMQIELGSTATDYEPYTGNQISVEFPTEAGTVYGATMTLNPDRTGTLVVNRASADLGAMTWSHNGDYWYNLSLVSVMKVNGYSEYSPIISEKYETSYPSRIISKAKTNIIANYTAALGGVMVYTGDNTTAPSGQLVYELASPQTYQLTAEQISGILTTLYGTNNIWADTGDIEKLTYHADLGKYIDSHITTAVANALNA